MIKNMIEGIIPILLTKVAAVPREEKLTYARFIGDLCFAYVNEDRETFEAMLSTTAYPKEWKKAIVRALWEPEPLPSNGGKC